MIQSEERGVKNSPVVDKDDISFSWLPIGRWANKKLINIPTARPEGVNNPPFFTFWNIYNYYTYIIRFLKRLDLTSLGRGLTH